MIMTSSRPLVWWANLASSSGNPHLLRDSQFGTCLLELRLCLRVVEITHTMKRAPKQLAENRTWHRNFGWFFFGQTFPEKSKFSGLKAMGQQAFTKGFHQSSVSLLVFTTCSDLHKTRWSCEMQPHSNTSHEITQAETQTRTIWGAA